VNGLYLPQRLCWVGSSGSPALRWLTAWLLYPYVLADTPEAGPQNLLTLHVATKRFMPYYLETPFGFNLILLPLRDMYDLKASLFYMGVLP
jgi:hypothetical protein